MYIIKAQIFVYEVSTDAAYPIQCTVQSRSLFLYVCHYL